MCDIEHVDLIDLQYAIGLARVDPAALGKAVLETALSLARQPGVLVRRAADLALAEAAVALDATRLWRGDDADPVAAPGAGDRRFVDRAWRDNPLLRATLGSYVVAGRVARRLLDDADVPDDVRRKARVALDVALDALAPSNVPWLNPSVVKELYETGGRSAWLGVANAVDDLLHNGGRPRQFDASGLEVGRTLAATPGRVVYANDLIELIAYEPQTETVFEQPVLYSPAWINKYYVLDLAPGRSFVEHAVRAGLTVFAISYRNPDASMAGLRLDDYLRDGLLTALDEVAALTGSETVNLVSVCIGATLAAMALGVLAARDRGDRVGWATINVGLVDFGDPGGAGAFTDADAIERMARQISKRGFFSGDEIASPFNLMRTTEFFWNYVVSNWYMGSETGAVRHPRVERRPAPAPCSHAHGIPARVLPREPARDPGCVRDRRDAHRPDARAHAAVRPRSGAGPHRTLALGLPRDAAAARRPPLRAHCGRPHRGDGQPARQLEGIAFRQRRVPA